MEDKWRMAQLDDLLRERWMRARNSGELVWKTKSGELIPIKDMTDTHLENAINCLARNEEGVEMWYDCIADVENAGDR